MTDRHQEIWDTLDAFMEECREHDSGYAMAAGYLQATVRSLLDTVPRSRQDQELLWMREFIRDRSHQRTMTALKQKETI
jgi:hypothetical protein